MSEKPELTELVRTAPERIYLQIGDLDYSADPFPYGDEVTWCADSVMQCEVAYVRADLAESALAPRVVSMEGLVAMGRVIAANAGEDWDNIGEFAQNIILDTQRAALEAFAESRK